MADEIGKTFEYLANASISNKKLIAFAVCIILLAFGGIIASQKTPVLYVYNITLNNTNLAPQFPGQVFGTGERLNNTTYYANSSNIDLHVFAHAMNVSDTASVEVYINDVLVSPRSGRPLGSAEQAYRGVDITIPRHASYKVVFLNYHHYEWREYIVK